jgi:hypothetical protein
MTESISRAVLTIATGKPSYVQMAINLARSFKWWHKNSSIQFVVATDQKNLIPPDLLSIKIIELQPGQYGQGFSPKLHLDQVAPAEHTLFIDADCLCVGSLEPIFEQFAGHAVSAIGGTISRGEWFGDIAAVCQKFGVPALPKFNGGIYYLEKGEVSHQVYTTARKLEPQYDKIGLVRLRNHPNDELLLAIAMALHNQTVIPDDGSILSDPQACPGDLSIDVLRGKSQLVNPRKPHPKHQDWYPFNKVHPCVVHFLGGHTMGLPYKGEALRLNLLLNKGWPLWAIDALATILYSLPHLFVRSTDLIKNYLRPTYHRFFGVREIPVSDRF